MLEPKRLRTQVASVVEPEDIHVSWFDISNPDAPVLKIYYDGAWRPIGGGEGPSGTAESTANKVTEISAESTDIQYPSAKAVYTALQSSAPADIFFSGTHAEVKGLRDSGTLVPGALYKITDYVATTTQEETQSANHPFDIIVRATAPDTLSEEALAAPHDGDTYFTGLGAKLEAWRLLYCIDNDTNHFEWADTENGKGVVYRLVDERGNDAPFDFKGILFLRDTEFWGSNAAATKIAENNFGTETPGDKWLYLFSGIDGEGNIIDFSKAPIIYEDEGEQYSVVTCLDNIFSRPTGLEPTNPFTIPTNVFIANVGPDGHVDVNNNTFGGSMTNNTFGGSVTANTFGSFAGDNIFVYDVTGNIVCGYLGHNTFGMAEDNVFVGSVNDNTFGEGVTSNVFGGNVDHSTFAEGASGNVFGGNISRSTFSGRLESSICSGLVNEATFSDDIVDKIVGLTMYPPGPKVIVSTADWSQISYIETADVAEFATLTGISEQDLEELFSSEVYAVLALAGVDDANTFFLQLSRRTFIPERAPGAGDAQVGYTWWDGTDTEDSMRVSISADGTNYYASGWGSE